MMGAITAPQVRSAVGYRRDEDWPRLLSVSKAEAWVATPYFVIRADLVKDARLLNPLYPDASPQKRVARWKRLLRMTEAPTLWGLTKRDEQKESYQGALADVFDRSDGRWCWANPKFVTLFERTPGEWWQAGGNNGALLRFDREQLIGFLLPLRPPS